jgi:transposase-like protein
MKKRKEKDENQLVRDSVYSEAFKLKVVKEVISGNFRSKEEARKFYEIKGKSSILEWIRLYSGAEGIDKQGKILKNRDSVSEEIAKQSMRIKELEEALKRPENS